MHLLVNFKSYYITNNTNYKSILVFFFLRECTEEIYTALTIMYIFFFKSDTQCHLKSSFFLKKLFAYGIIIIAK